MRIKAGERANWDGTENFSLELGSEKYPLFRFCYDYIITQKLNGTKIPVAEKALESLRLYDRKKTQSDQDMNIVCNYHLYSEQELKTAVESIQDRLADPTDISFYDYVSENCKNVFKEQQGALDFVINKIKTIL